jgi:hypothetical protein
MSVLHTFMHGHIIVLCIEWVTQCVLAASLREGFGRVCSVSPGWVIPVGGVTAEQTHWEFSPGNITVTWEYQGHLSEYKKKLAADRA